jgi:hypothetical protein
VAELKTTVCFCAGDKSCDKICSNCKGKQEQYLKDDQELNNYLLQEAVNDANLFTNAQTPAISGIANFLILV